MKISFVRFRCFVPPSIGQHEVRGRGVVGSRPIIGQRTSAFRRQRDAPRDDLVDDDLGRAAKVETVVMAQLGEEVIFVHKFRRNWERENGSCQNYEN